MHRARLDCKHAPVGPGWYSAATRGGLLIKYFVHYSRRAPPRERRNAQVCVCLHANGPTLGHGVYGRDARIYTNDAYRVEHSRHGYGFSGLVRVVIGSRPCAVSRRNRSGSFACVSHCRRRISFVDRPVFIDLTVLCRCNCEDQYLKHGKLGKIVITKSVTTLSVWNVLYVKFYSVFWFWLEIDLKVKHRPNDVQKTFPRAIRYIKQYTSNVEIDSKKFLLIIFFVFCFFQVVSIGEKVRRHWNLNVRQCDYL